MSRASLLETGSKFVDQGEVSRRREGKTANPRGWVSVSTSDIIGAAGDLHKRSLDSAVCGQAVGEPVERHLEGALIGDTPEWSVHVAPSPPEAGDWNHTETGAALTLANQGSLVDDDVLSLCEITLGLWTP